MRRIRQTSDSVIVTNRPHNLFYYWQKRQKSNIHSNTDLIYKVQVKFHENRHTHTHTHTHQLFLRCWDYHFKRACNFWYWVVGYQVILRNLGTIRRCKSYQICWLFCTSWEYLFFRNYVQGCYLDSSDKLRSCSRIYFF